MVDSVEKNTACHKRTAQDVPKVRLALPSDFEAVMAMNAEDDNFRRQDYMHTEYMNFLKDPYLRCFLCVVQGQPVLFGIGQYGMDAGQSIIVRSLRSLQGSRGKGYTLYFFKFLYDMDPGKTFLGYSARDPQTSKSLNGALSHVENRTEHHFFATETSLNQEMAVDVLLKDAVQELTAQEFCDLFRDEKLNGYFYPNKYFVMDTLIAQPMETNRKFILERANNMAILASNSLFIKSSAKHSDQTTGIISFNTWFPCPDGFINKIEVYGQVNSTDDLQAHLMAHAQVLQANSLYGEVKVTVAKDGLSLDEAELTQICEDVGLKCHGEPPTHRIIMQGNHLLGSRLRLRQ